MGPPSGVSTGCNLQLCGYLIAIMATLNFSVGINFWGSSSVMPLTPIQGICVLVVVLASAIIVYTLFGYPLLLGWMANRQEKPVRRDNVLRSVSFVIAVHNGEKFLERKLNSILALNYPRELMEIIVVSDGSDDRTDEIARSFEPQGVRLIRLPRGGKPAALSVAAPLAAGEILALTDIRQTLHPDSLRNAISCFADPKVGAVSGELQMAPAETSEENDFSIYWRYEVWIRKQMSRIDSTFGCNGPFYLMRRSLWVPVSSDTLLDDVYLPMTAFFKGFRLTLDSTAIVYETPIGLHSEFTRKVRLQAGLYQTLQLMPEMLTRRNRMRFHFVSGKYFRMLLPYCLIGIALATIGLPSPWRNWAIAGQIAFYGLAALDVVLPAKFPLKKLTSPIRTFVVLISATLIALRVFFVPPQSLWKDKTVRLTEAPRMR